MGVHLVSKDERYTHTVSGCEFYYRRMPGNTKARIVKENTNRQGVTDFEQVGLEALDYGLLGWSGVTGDGPGGSPVPVEFDKKLAPMIPENDRIDIAEKILGGKLTEVAKSLDPTKTSGSIIEL